MTDRLKVLYIAGWGRSGSTILESILGQLPGFFAAGELRYLWDRGVLQNRRCGCGSGVRDCTTWRAILDRAYGGLDPLDARAMVELEERSIRTRHLVRMLAGRHGDELAPPEYRRNLAQLYQAIATETGSRVVVDSSKAPSYGFVVGELANVDLYVVHLVRDPRAVAHSWLRRKLQPAEDRKRHMRRHGPVYSSLMWNLWNEAAHRLWGGDPGRYLLLRYEDFVAAHEDTVAQIVDLLDIAQPSETPFVGERTVSLRPTHSVSGNPSRFSTGVVSLTADDEWESRMARRHRVAAAAVAAPLLARYGYRG
jgi:hypothetical protein